MLLRNAGWKSRLRFAVVVAGAIACISFGAPSARSQSPVAAAHVMAQNAAHEQPDNLTSTAVEIQGANGRALLSAFAIAGTGTNGPAGSIQPGAGLWDERTDRAIADIQINVPPSGNFDTAVSNANHDAPSVIRTSAGNTLEAYGAASTYHGYTPPQSWSCGGGVFCEPFKFAPAGTAPREIVGALAASREYLLPSPGLSELSSATLGGTTILAGQQQTASPLGQSGAQGFVVLHDSGHQIQFDTASGPWDFRSVGTQPAQGLQTITLAPSDDAYIDFSIRSANGPGSIDLTIGGEHCAMQGVAGTPDSVASAYARYVNSSCAQFAKSYRAMQVRYDPAQRAAGAQSANAVVGIVAAGGDPSRLPAAGAIALTCTGGIVCASPAGLNRVQDVRGSGLHRHFLWGGVLRAGAFIYDVLDVEQVTGSWYGAGHNSLALALACFRAQAPSGAVWQWTNCAGKAPFRLAPGMQPVSRLGAGSAYLLRAPRSGYAAGMTPYTFDWRMSAQPPASGTSFPVVSAESAVELPDGKLLVAHDCQSSSGDYSICFLRYDTESGETLSAGFVDRGNSGGSLASIVLRRDGTGGIALGAIVGMGQRWGCAAPGRCAITYAYDARTNRWKRAQTVTIGGTNNVGFPGVAIAGSKGFVFQTRELISSANARLETFEVPAPQ